MAKTSIWDRLDKLENRRKFLDWFVKARLYDSLTDDELEACASGRGYPDPIPNRPSGLDTLDRKSLVKLWQEDCRMHEGRSHADLEYYTQTGYWPEQKGRLHYYEEAGKLGIEWRDGQALDEKV